MLPTFFRIGEGFFRPLHECLAMRHSPTNVHSHTNRSMSVHVHNVSSAWASTRTIRGLPAQSSDPNFAQDNPRIVPIRTLRITYIYVGRKAWICAIHGLRCAKHGSTLCAGNQWIAQCERRKAWICAKHGSTVCAGNPWIVCSIHGLRSVKGAKHGYVLFATNHGLCCANHGTG